MQGMLLLKWVLKCFFESNLDYLKCLYNIVIYWIKCLSILNPSKNLWCFSLCLLTEGQKKLSLQSKPLSEIPSFLKTFSLTG